jgi:F-type H+-transporting ATPase subunit epsilon
MSELNVIVVTPEETALEATTTFVALPLHDGEKGIGANHAPMIGKLGYGELRFEQDGKTVRFYVDGGFVQIADNVVSVITERAIPAAKLKEDEVKELLETASNQAANSDELLNAREKAVGQARAQLRVASRK